MNDFKKIGLEAVEKAGIYLLSQLGKAKKIKDKAGGADILTTADKGAEELIADLLHINFPSHAIFSEESGDMFGGKDFQWVMDPLDGTKHFIKGLPFFAVSLTLRNFKEPLMSFLNIPATREIFITEKEKGTYRNGVECHVSNENFLENAIVYVEFPSTKFKVEWKKESYDLAWKKYEKLTRVCLRTRAYGSGPIGMAYMAMGAFDAYVRFQPLSYEDVIGGSLMIKESGGTLTDQNGKALNINGNDLNTRIVASNGRLHKQILDIIK